MGLGLQAIIPFISLYVALLLRLDLDPGRINMTAFWIWASVLTSLRLISLIQFRAHTGLWRYVSVPDLMGIAKASTVSTIVFALLLWLISDFETIPRSIPIIEWGVHIFLAGGLRIIVRIGRERLKASKQSTQYKTRVLIVGAGDAGAAFCRQVLSTPDFLIEPVALIDDDIAKTGQSLSGVPVVGTSQNIPTIVKSMQIDMVVIAVPSATPEQRSQIVEYAREAHVEFRILPATDELLKGNVSISKLRRVDVSDLLGRPETQLHDEALRATFTNKTVLITGASSGIGEAFAKKLASEKANLVITARSEEKLESLAGDLERVYSIRVYVYPMDLSEDGSAKDLYDKIKESGHSIDVLINNAAFGKSGKFLDTDMKLYKSMIMLNLNSLVELSYLCLPEMLQKNDGGIINVASTVAFLPLTIYPKRTLIPRKFLRQSVVETSFLILSHFPINFSQKIMCANQIRF